MMILTGAGVEPPKPTNTMSASEFMVSNDKISYDVSAIGATRGKKPKLKIKRGLYVSHNLVRVPPLPHFRKSQVLRSVELIIVPSASVAPHLTSFARQFNPSSPAIDLSQRTKAPPPPLCIASESHL